MSLQITSKEKYDESDLKRFLVQQRFIMEDALLELAKKSVHRFVECIISFLPLACVVKDTCDVVNTFYTADQIKALGAPKPKFPLFKIDVVLNDKNEPEYSHSADDVVHSILSTFDNGLKGSE